MTLSKQTLRTLAALERKWQRQAAKATDAAASAPFELREAWLRHQESERKRLRKWERFGVGPPHIQPVPDWAQGATCCGDTPDGPCARTDLNEFNGRCPQHGGLSTGPTSEEGRCQCERNLGERSARHTRMLEAMAALDRAKRG